jgi:hypothetical protein
MSSKSKWFYALIFTASLLVVCVCIAFSPRAHANDASEQEAIIHAMKKIFHRPEAPLQVDPVALEGDAAIAGWSQGEMGGRAFLRKRKGEWTIILCSGDQLKATETLLTAGLPKQQAEKLAARLSDAEKNLPSARLALFAKFDGLLRIENGQDHPPHKH